MALHYDDDRCVFTPLLPDWDWEWELRCTHDDDAAARDGLIHDAFTALPSCKKPTAACLPI
jgi:hypothetical protein